jgi:hypothetical protein
MQKLFGLHFNSKIMKTMQPNSVWKCSKIYRIQKGNLSFNKIYKAFMQQCLPYNITKIGSQNHKARLTHAKNIYKKTH